MESEMKTTFSLLTVFRQGSMNNAMDDNVYIAELPRCKPPSDTSNRPMCKPPPFSSGLSKDFKARLQPTWRERKVPAALPPVPKSTLVSMETSMGHYSKPRTFSGTNVRDPKIFSNQKKGCHSAGTLDTRDLRLPEMTAAKPKEPSKVIVTEVVAETKENSMQPLFNRRSVLEYDANNLSCSTRTNGRLKDSPRPQMNTPNEFTSLSFNLNQPSVNSNGRRVAFGSSYICSPYSLKSNPTNCVNQQRPTRSILRSRGESQFFTKPPINPKDLIERFPEKNLYLKKKEEAQMDYLTLHMLARRTRGPLRFKYMRMLESRQKQA